MDSLANHFLIRARFSQRTLIKVLTTLFAFLHNSNFAAATSTGGIGDCLTEGIIADESLIAAFLPCLFFRKVIWPFFLDYWWNLLSNIFVICIAGALVVITFHPEVEFVHPVSAGSSVKFLPVV